MAEETARQMALDCREKSPDWPDRFPLLYGISKKNRNVENRDIGLVNE